MKRIIFFAIALMFSISLSFSQEIVDIKGTSTCEQALDISIFKRFGPTTAPQKYGTENPLNFERAKYPAWYKFTLTENGVLTFDIIPTNVTDNYDFMLFKAEENFCTKYKNGQLAPLRTCFGASDSKRFGQTGLSYAYDNVSYMQPIEVSKGETYYLALNNDFLGGGHTLVINVLRTFMVKGTVNNIKNENPVKAALIWQTMYSDNIRITENADKKGDYKMKIAVNNFSNTFPKYEFIAHAENYFPDVKVFSTAEANELENQIVNFNLNKIKKGTNNENLGVIYFEPNEHSIVPESNTTMRKLLITMQLNPKTEVILEGHTNGLYPSTEVDLVLSETRSKIVKTYLTDNGIAPERIEVRGYGSEHEVYPTPRTEEEEGFNRRVEVNFVKF